MKHTQEQEKHHRKLVAQINSNPRSSFKVNWYIFLNIIYNYPIIFQAKYNPFAITKNESEDAFEELKNKYTEKREQEIQMKREMHAKILNEIGDSSEKVNLSNIIYLIKQF